MVFNEPLLEPDKAVTEIFCLCRSAEVVDGSLNIVGASTRLAPGGLSVVVPQITVVGSVRFPLHREGLHAFKVTALDLHGKPVAPAATGEARIVAQGNDVYAWLTFAVVVASSAFRAPGDFRFDLAIDGEHLASSWLCVVRE